MAKLYIGYGCNNYPGEANDLKGCVNDVLLARNLMYRSGFKKENLRLYTDEAVTLAHLIEGLEYLATRDWNISDSENFFVFHFAGHGAPVPDVSGDEPDGFDEALVPHDFASSGMLLDDTISEYLKQIPSFVKGVFLFDCCYSGGLTRYSGQYPGGIASLNAQSRPRMLTPTAQNLSLMTEGELPLYEKTRKMAPKGNRSPIELPKQFLVFNAASEYQTASDAYIASADAHRGAFHGAFSYCFLETLAAADFRISYSDLLTKTQRALRDRGFTQTPTLFSDRARLDKLWGD